jgi:hypothetical protein
MKKETPQAKKLKEIEERGYKMGTSCADCFDETQNISSLRAAVSAYRLSMQAMRDQIKHKIVKK